MNIKIGNKRDFIIKKNKKKFHLPIHSTNLFEDLKFALKCFGCDQCENIHGTTFNIYAFFNSKLATNQNVKLLSNLLI